MKHISKETKNEKWRKKLESIHFSMIRSARFKNPGKWKSYIKREIVKKTKTDIIIIDCMAENLKFKYTRLMGRGEGEAHAAWWALGSV